jgi:hypothetical protein
MGKSIDKETSREIRRKIREILMGQWDPIGVDGIPEAADEYDGYIGGVYELLRNGATPTALSDYLRSIEVVQMEMVNASGQPLLPDSTRDSAVSSLGVLRSFFA